jgi:hypothetical protein
MNGWAGESEDGKAQQLRGVPISMTHSQKITSTFAYNAYPPAAIE